MSEGGLIPGKYFGAVKAFGLALVLIVAGAVASWLAAGSQQFFNEGRERIPGTVRFDAKAATYDVFVSGRVGSGSLTPEVLVRRVRCTVAHPGSGAPEEVRGGVREITEFSASVGSFRGQGGPTSVTCAWTDTRTGRQVSNRFVVAGQLTILRYGTYTLFAVGGLLVLLGLLLVRRASRQPA